MAKKPVPKKRSFFFFKKRFFGVLFLGLLLMAFWKAMQPPEWWQYSPDEQITQQPVVYRDKIILATNHGTLIGLNQRTGKVEWQLSHEKDVASQPFMKKGLLYTGYVDGTIVAVNPSTGRTVWSYVIPHSKLIFSSLNYSETTLIFGDSGGTVRGISLWDGREKWAVTTPNPDTVDELLTKDGLQWFGTLLQDRGKIYVIRTHGFIAEINPDNGHVNWRTDLQSTMKAEPILTRTNLLLSTSTHQLISLNRGNGEVAESPQNSELQDSAVFCQTSYSPKGLLSDLYKKTAQQSERFLIPFERELNENVIQVDTEGKVTAVNPRTLARTRNVELGFAPQRCFYDQDAGLYVSSKDGRISKIDVLKKTVVWTKNTGAKILSISSVQKQQYLEQNNTRKYYYTDMIFLSDDQQQLTRIHPDTGEAKWTSNTAGSLYVPPVLNSNQLFIISTNGGLSRLNATTGKPDQSLNTTPIKVEPIAKIVQKGEIYELQVTAPSTKYENPYTAVDISSEFTQAGQTIPIQGFYYDKDEWRVRFNPPTEGNWSWKLTWKDAFQTKDFSGNFESARKFTPLHTVGDTQWLTNDGKSIKPIVGFNDCIVDANRDGSPLNDFYIRDGGMRVATTSSDIPDIFTFNNQFITLDSYLDAYKPAFTTFRESVSNCSPPLYYAENFLYSRYLAHEGSYYDQLSQALFQRGMHVWFTMFGFSLPFDGAVRYPDERVAVENYVEYIVARYGAYVDIWEISNEAVAGEEYIQLIARLIEQNDPYHRLITVSWDKPGLEEIGLIAPHWYQSEGDNESDLATVNQLEKFKEFNKPIVFGEQGNVVQNWDPTSADRMRVRIWTAFFNQAGILFWNQSGSKDHYNPTFENSNIYLGDEEREYSSNFLQLTKDLPVTLVPGVAPRALDQVRSYILKNEDLFLQYSFHAEYTESTSISFSNPFSTVSYVDWFDPKTGKFIRRDELQPGQSISSPQFTRDLFVKVRKTLSP